MKLAAVATLAPVMAASANFNYPRQAASSSVASAATPATSQGSGVATGSVPLTSVPPALSTVSWTLPSTNPTAVPVSQITSGAPTSPTLPLTTTYAAGATPTFLPNAPALPNIATIIPSNYPALDRPPPTDSPEVQQWKQEVLSSGVTIPDFQPTVAGGCGANIQAAQDTSRCWWTCGGCVGPDDITTCPDKYNWGLTYDDGPAYYTPNLLQYLDQVNLKTTFFVVGSRAISFPALLQEEYMGQHQIAVHTWSHPALTTQSTDSVIAELGWSKKIIKDVLGVTPIYFRPPYGDIDNRVRAIAKAMGLIPIMWTRISPTATFDTGDYNVAGGTISTSQVLNNWEHIIGNASTINTGFIVLEHDLFPQTVEIATGYILPAGLANNPPLKIEPVISCMKQPLSNSYVETNDNTTNPIPGTSSVGSASTGTGAAQSSSTGGSSSGGSTSGNTSNHSGAVHGVSSALAVASTTVLVLFAGFATLL